MFKSKDIDGIANFSVKYYNLLGSSQ